MADPDVGASDAQRQITEELRLYNVLMTEFIDTELTTTTRDATRSENLKRFFRFHPMEDDPLCEQKMPLYQAQLRAGLVNSKDSDTDSRSDGEQFNGVSESSAGLLSMIQERKSWKVPRRLCLVSLVAPPTA